MSCPSKSTRKRKLQTSECEKPAKKRMAWESFKSIEDFGYKFNEEGRLVNIEDGSGFNFYVDPDHTYNQRNYEALGEVITEYIYELLQGEDVGLKKLEIPQEKGSSILSFAKQKSKSDEAKGFIFVSEDFEKKDRLLVLVHGSGVVRAGQWARRLIINDCLDHGTQIPYIKRAIKDGYGVVVTNTNQNEALVEVKGQTKYKSIKESESPEKHFSYVWKNIIEKTSASKIFAVAHSYGGYLVVNYFDRYPNILGRVVAVAFTDSVHSLRSNARANVRSWFLKNSVNWATSDTELDAPMYYQDDNNHLTRVSAGTTRHEETSWKAMESVFKYFQNQELDFDNKKSEAGKCKGNSSKNKKKKNLAPNFSKKGHVITTELLGTGNHPKRDTTKTNSEGISTESGEKQISSEERNLKEKQGETTSNMESDHTKVGNSTGQDGMNEYVVTGESGEESKDIKNIKENDGIANEPSKPKDGSEPNEISDDKKEPATGEISKEESVETKSIELKSDGDLDEDTLKSGLETSDKFKIKNNKEFDNKQPKNSCGQDDSSEHVEDDEAPSKDIEETKKRYVIASKSSKTEDDSEPDKINDDKREAITVEIPKKPSEESTSSEQESKNAVDGDVLNTGPEIPDDVRNKSNNEVQNIEPEKSPRHDEKNENKESEKALNNIEEIGNGTIASESSKTEDGSEPDKASDETKGTITVEVSAVANRETKSSEDKGEGDFEKDALKCGAETPDKVKCTSNSEGDNNKPEDSPGQDEMNKSVEGEDEMVKDGEDLKMEIHVECVDSEANGAIENQPAESAASNSNGGANTIDPKCNEPSDEVVDSQKEQTDNNSENSGDDPSKADASSTNDQHEKKLEADKVEKKPAEVSSEDKLSKGVSIEQENVDETSNDEEETANNAGKSTASKGGENEGVQATPGAPGGIGENLGTDSFNGMQETAL